jgi:hypothetical protein
MVNRPDRPLDKKRKFGNRIICEVLSLVKGDWGGVERSSPPPGLQRRRS